MAKTIVKTHYNYPLRERITDNNGRSRSITKRKDFLTYVEADTETGRRTLRFDESPKINWYMKSDGNNDIHRMFVEKSKVERVTTPYVYRLSNIASKLGLKEAYRQAWSDGKYEGQIFKQNKCIIRFQSV